MSLHVCAVELPNGIEGLSEDLFERALASVDEASRARIRKFFRREDAWRCLIGRMLPFYVLGDRASDVRLAHTAAGKPYFVSSDGSPAAHFAFNVSHDSSLVVMAYDADASADTEIGVDVMRCRLPPGETPRSFLRVLGEQLTALEKRALQSQVDQQAAFASSMFRLWALKEAYTKTLGLGLGFDFARVECNLEKQRVRIDGQSPAAQDGWEFIETSLEVHGDPYAIVAARRHPRSHAQTQTEGGAAVEQRVPDITWFTRIDAVHFVEDRLRQQGASVSGE